MLSLVVSYDMFQLTEQEQLWGYRPLTLLLSLWGAILLGRIWWRSWRGFRIRWRWLRWSTLSGVLLGVGFPDLLPFPFLVFIGWVPLLLLERQLAQRPEASYGLAFRYGFHTFFLWNTLATYWVANTALLAGVFAIVANSLLMSVAWLLFHFVHRHTPKVAYLSLIAFFFCFDYMHLHWDLAWPWMMLGNSLAEWPWAVQWYEWTGVFGGSLWIWVVNLLFLRAYIQSGNRWLTLRQLLPAFLLIAVPLVYSIIRYATYTEQGKETINVVVVQPNYEPHYQKFEIPEEVQLERFTALSLSQLDAQVDYLVFPETSFGTVEERRVDKYGTFRKLRADLAAYPQLRIVSGINGYRDFGNQPGPSNALREQPDKRGDAHYYDVSNAAVQLRVDEAADYQVYRKGKLVPGPEIFPFKDLFFFMEPLIEALDGTTAGLATQPEVTLFTGPKAKIAPVICYESVFGEYFGSYVRKGAQTAFIMTNDGWWADTGGHRQHLHFASLRAIETRRDIARSANTGISAFINQRGDILQPTVYGEAAAIRGTIHLNDELTFYARRGDLLARLGLFLAALFLLNAIVRKIIKRGDVQEEEE